MACPYFYPIEPGLGGTDPRSAMLPLGDLWAGDCSAAPGAPPSPGDPALRLLCNMGYARGACPEFPAGDGPDAVRFTVRGADGTGVRLYYVLERDHHPFAHGPLEYSLASRSLAAQPSGGSLSRQAEAYAESYLRRTGPR